jgi:hypothetical protein
MEIPLIKGDYDCMISGESHERTKMKKQRGRPLYVHHWEIEWLVGIFRNAPSQAAVLREDR